MDHLLGTAQFPYTLPAAYLLDLLLGDPRGWPHPVRGIGWMIARGEGVLRRAVPCPYVAGILLVAVVCLATSALAALVVIAARWIGPQAEVGAEVLLIYWGLATGSLASETWQVVQRAERGEWPEARRELSRIVGRDTDRLTPEEVHRACIETVAENTTDAVVTPLVLTALGGPVALWVFKAASTMDSMIGHRDARYLKFGWAAARLDDILNFIPARLTYLTLPLASLWLKPLSAVPLSVLNGWRIGWRDRNKHDSPNAGLAEATMAGLLGVQLGGPVSYAGATCDRPWIGDSHYPAGAGQVRQAIVIMSSSSVLVCSLATLWCWLLAR